jgi:putative endonuclease
MRRLLGQRGEAAAEAHLLGKGYRILARNYRFPFGELDLVAEEGGAVVIIEVKTRRAGRAGSAAEAISPHKRLRLIRLARYYLAVDSLAAASCRFDVVTLSVRSDRVRVEVVRHAFGVA